MDLLSPLLAMSRGFFVARIGQASRLPQVKNNKKNKKNSETRRQAGSLSCERL